MAADLGRSWAALAAEASDLRALLAAQPADAWARPTRLTGWDVTVLAAHLARGVGRVAAYAATPVDQPAERDRVSYWRYDAPGMAGDVDARARAEAAGKAPTDILAALDAAIQAGAAIVAQRPPGTVIPSVLGPITLADYVPTRVTEACLHGLDLRHALGAPLTPTPEALAITVATLDALLAGARPADLRDDVAFSEAASGRRLHPDPRFPVIS